MSKERGRKSGKNEEMEELEDGRTVEEGQSLRSRNTNKEGREKGDQGIKMR